MASPGGQTERELTKKFVVQKFLGKGSYGSVYRVKRISDGKVYALKETDVKHMSQQERAEAVNEIRLLASIQHANVVSYHEAFIDGNRLCIVLEYAPYGDLARAIRKGQTMKKPFPEDMIWSFFSQACRGVQALHRARILHRDVKAANVLITSSDTVKIGDLGISKFMKSSMTKTQIGTPHYMPPEVWKNQPYSFSSDMWALGCLLYEMATFTVPFEARSMSELRYKVLRGKYAPVPQYYSHDLASVVHWLLDPNPESRPNIDKVMASEALAKRVHLLPEALQAVPTAGGSMLQTIQVPRNLKLLQGRLPAPFYPDEMPLIGGGSGPDRQDRERASWPRSDGGLNGALPAIGPGLTSVSDPVAPPSSGRASVKSSGSVSSRPLVTVDDVSGARMGGGRRPSEFNKPQRQFPAGSGFSSAASGVATPASLDGPGPSSAAAAALPPGARRVGGAGGADLGFPKGLPRISENHAVRLPNIPGMRPEPYAGGQMGGGNFRRRVAAGPYSGGGGYAAA